MENPCEKCLVKTMCTQICPEKINHGILLKAKFNSHFSIMKATKERYYYRECKKINNLLKYHLIDVARINRMKNPCKECLFLKIEATKNYVYSKWDIHTI